MYDPRLIARTEAAILADPAIRPIFPQGFPSYSLDDRRALTAQIIQSRDPAPSEPIRRLTPEEEAFVGMSRIRIIYDVPFYLETFVWIDEEGHGLRPLYPLWDS